MEEKLNLLAKLAAKKLEIQALVAKKQGMVAFSDFTPLSYKRLEVLADQNLEHWLAADRTGDCHARRSRFQPTCPRVLPDKEAARGTVRCGDEETNPYLTHRSIKDLPTPHLYPCCRRRIMPFPVLQDRCLDDSTIES
jgi:hypothetical protein